ncbi:MAG: glycosyltransferase N-terminal domain-containing protein [Chthoniobacteraceae bacterium]
MADPLPADARRSLLIYNLFFPLVFLFLLPGFLLRMARRGCFREKFGQRLGRYDAADRARFAGGRWIWIHSISVGETLIALKLARELHTQAPDFQIALSVTTSTGLALASEEACDRLAAIYNPIDSRGCVRAALDLIRPEKLLLIEGEVWPNLVAECRRRRIPVSLVNARLSPRSERRMRAARQWVGPIFRLLDGVLVPEAEDVARWKSLGVSAEKIRVTGSIKFDSPAGVPTREAEFRALLVPLGVTEKTPIFLGGSTWFPEEKILADALRHLRAEFPNLFLILVPRHVERSAEILRSLAPLRVVRRSALPLAQPCDVLLVDTTGELRDWYALATLVFVGKSLPQVEQAGGQNPAEPAALGKPVLFGPRMDNFASIVGHLLAHGAARSVADPASLEREAAALLRDPAARSTMAAAASAALASHTGATERTARLLLEPLH